MKPAAKRGWFAWGAVMALSAGMGLVGLTMWGRSQLYPASRALHDYGRLPPFSLTDHDGLPITRDYLQGKVWIAAFFFSRCAGQCPLISTQMARLQQTMVELPDVSFVSFTLDPSYDTPERLSAYARHYGATSGRWRFVTGDQSALHRLARDGFRLSVAEGTSEAEPIIHSTRLILVDAQGHIRGYYDALDSEAMSRLAADARVLILRPIYKIAPEYPGC